VSALCPPRKKLTTRVCVVLLIQALLLVGCGSGGSETRPNSTGQNNPYPAGQNSPSTTTNPYITPTVLLTPTPVIIRGTISIWHSWNEDELPALVQIINGFRQLYPEVYFDVLYVPAQDLQARYELETRQGSGPTLLLGPAEWGPALFEGGLVADLTGLVGQDRLATLNQPALEAGRIQDKQAGLPYSLQGIVLFRNKDIVTLSPNTFDELVTLAQTSTQGEILGAILDRSFYYAGGHLNGLGGKLMDENHLPAFNNEFGLNWIDLLKRFEEAGPPNFFTEDDLKKFSEGKAGWIIEGTWRIPELAETLGLEKVAIDPWPTYEAGRLSGYVFPENIYLSTQAKDDDRLAAKTFLDYFLSPEAQTRLAEVGRIPASSGAALTDPVKGPLLAQGMAALAGGTAYPVEPEIVEYNLNLDIALRSIFEQNVPPAEALQIADDNIRQAIQESQADATPTP
jgi:ABC-type glycerol-3-phosphate transport system substrate-binding protein